MIPGAPHALSGMTDHPKFPSERPERSEPSEPERPAPLDDLIDELLDCGGVLSQIITAMVEFQAGGRAAPDQAPTPEIAHSVIRGVSGGLAERFSPADLETTATVVHELTEALCSELFVVGPDLN